MSPKDELTALLDILYQRKTFGIKPGLQNTFRLFDRLGLKTDSLPVVHIAGTNGKGSTASLMESVLRASGYSTGLFTSPHLVCFNERFKLSGKEVGDDRLLSAGRKLMGVLAEDDADHPENPITFFECSTALAMMIFNEANVDIAIMETGLGGRLDATTILDPVLTVITRIERDHMQWLGDTLAKIAWEKAGILKPGVPVVIGAQHDEAREVLLSQATAVKAAVYLSDHVQIVENKRGIHPVLSISSPNDDYGKIRFPLAGRFQYENVSTALTALEVLNQMGWEEVTRKTVKEGIESTVWPGRMEVVKDSPLTILDCAHNSSGMNAFLDALDRVKESKQSVGFIFGCSADKEIGDMLKRVSKTANRIWLVEFDHERSASLAVLEETVSKLNITTPVQKGDLQSMMEDAWTWAAETDSLLAVGGSIFLVGEWKARFQ